MQAVNIYIFSSPFLSMLWFYLIIISANCIVSLLVCPCSWQLWLFLRSFTFHCMRGTCNLAIQNTELGNMTSWHFKVQFTQQMRCCIFRFWNVSFWDFCRPQCSGGGWKICFAMLKNSAATRNQNRHRPKRNPNKHCWQGCLLIFLPFSHVSVPPRLSCHCASCEHRARQL